MSHEEPEHTLGAGTSGGTKERYFLDAETRVRETLLQETLGCPPTHPAKSGQGGEPGQAAQPAQAGGSKEAGHP